MCAVEGRAPKTIVPFRVEEGVLAMVSPQRVSLLVDSSWVGIPSRMNEIVVNVVVIILLIYSIPGK
jgi:hypothetical protein